MSLALTEIDDYRIRTMERVGKVKSENLEPSSDVLDSICREALDEFSKILPRQIVTEAVGDGATKRYVLDTLLGSQWREEPSDIQRIYSVTDANTDAEKQTEIEEETWFMRQGTDGNHALFLPETIGTSTTLRVVWTLPHTVDKLDEATATTVPAKFTEALILLTAAATCEWISRTASTMSNSTIGVDQVDFDPIDIRWAKRAKALRVQASERFQPGLVGSGAGYATEWNRNTRLGGSSRISH